MNIGEFLKLMNFPKQWVELNMYPEILSKIQIAGYKPGQEEASEHYRNGAFHWWLRQEPTESVLMKLMLLASIDPDFLLGKDIHGYIRKAKNYTQKVENVCGS